jgi:hypothetical protein
MLQKRVNDLILIAIDNDYRFFEQAKMEYITMKRRSSLAQGVNT